jgi:hypothetical protein
MANIAGTKLIVILVLVKLVVSTVHQLRFHNFVISGWEKKDFSLPELLCWRHAFWIMEEARQ